VAALTYDSMGLLFSAIKKSTSLDRKVVRDSLATIVDFSGVTGDIKFLSGSGDPVKSAVIMQVKGDKFVWVMNAAP
jgi:branched-chain amino acid transport system substrate-binding protein